MIKKLLPNLINKKSLVKNRQKGQILIIFLLILVVGLALVLSVASRSITDIRLTTTSDESNRAYFAAEAGIEEALKQLQNTATDPFLEAELNFTDINQTTAKIKASPLTTLATQAYEFPQPVAKDEVVQASLLLNFNDDTVGPHPMDTDAANGTLLDEGGLEIYWGDTGTPDPTDSAVPAILVTVLYKTSTGDFELEKYAYDPFLLRGGFCNAFLQDQSVVTNLSNGALKLFKYKVDLDILSADACTGSSAVPTNSTPILARIRLLYNDTAWPVAVRGDGWDLPQQGTEVESTGTTTSGVTRKLKVTQQYPALPSIFDYVLFSGGDLTK